MPHISAGPVAPPPPSLATTVAPPTIVISQIFGGGGNSGATYRNDFIELFNPGTTPVSVAGWSVQYAASAGSSWSVIQLSGTIPPGGYYLVQGAAGTGGTTNLPAADASGSINLAAGAGKVALSSQNTPLPGTSCPVAGGSVVDVVTYGANNCAGSANPAPGPSNNVQSAIRNDAGCAFTGNPTADFTLVTAGPRNSSTTAHACETAQAQPATITITPDSTGVVAGSAVTFSAAARDADGNPVSATFGWSTSDITIATIDGNGVATGVTAGVATITATANGVTAKAKLSVTTMAPPQVQPGDIVISQIYGGGGNSGSLYRNDFIELFNRSTQPVRVDGWSVQYASAAGSFTQATPLSGTIQPGAYYLVQEAAGGGGTVDLPTPDVTGTINLAGTAGKVLLARVATPLGVACPTASVIEIVSFGSGTNCGTFTPTLTNTTAAIRKYGGCGWTPDPSVDFVAAAPAPRNSSSSTRSCVVGPLDHVVVSGTLTVVAGSTTQLSATALDANDNPIANPTIVWSSGNSAVATVDATGRVSGLVANTTPVGITATAMANGVTKMGTALVKVNNDGINWVDVSSSSTSFPPGFQTQLFLTARAQQGGAIIPATFTFEAVDPQYATVQTVQNTGIVTGVAAPPDGSRPTFRVIATPVDGGSSYEFLTRPITIEQPATAPASIYVTNDEFGDPTPANSTNPNDFLIRRDQFTISYNQSRGTPNWVSYELDSRHMVAGQDRCNCFTADPLLPAARQIFTSDYTNGGYDRGHMARSADRTAGNVDNAITFYLTNVVPQTADLNQGVWAQFENALADSARAGRAVYIITGPLYSRSHGLTFIKNEGKIAIPDSTWKVALIGPRNGGNPFTRNDVQSWDDLEGLSLMVVNMPNIAGVRNDPWSKYLTTVDRIEEATGYDFLSLLKTGFRGALQYHDRPPVARMSFSGTQDEGSPITFDASESTDPDFGRTDLGRTEALSYSWHFSDGTTANGKVVTKTFADNGTYTATLTVTDAFGWPNSRSTRVTIANVAPTATFNAPSGVSAGLPIVLSLSHVTDPSSVDIATGFTFAFDCGDGNGYRPWSSSSSVSCPTSQMGTRSVHGKVMDKDGGFTEYSGAVIVGTPRLTAVGPAMLWIGAKPNEAAGFRVDLRAEVLVNGVVVASGDLNNVPAGSKDFNNARLNSIALSLLNGSVEVPAGARVSFRPSVRRTCSDAGSDAGRIEFWYNGDAIDQGASRDAGTRFEATIGGATSSFFARTSSLLGTTPGAAMTSIDLTVNGSVSCPARPFTPIGTWSR